MAKLARLDHLNTILAQIDTRLEGQVEEWDGLDRKGTAIMATTGVVLGLVVNNAKAFQGYPEPAPTVFNGALAILAAGLAAGVATLWPRGFKAVPDPDGLVRYADEETEALVGTLISTKAEAFKRNGSVMNWKARTVRVQMVLLSAAAILLFLIVWYWR